jgi:putative membrane protein
MGADGVRTKALADCDELWLAGLAGGPPAENEASTREAREANSMRVSIGIIALVVSAVSASAADFNAEADFVTRAANSNLFAVTESRLALNRTRDPHLKILARRLLEEHGRAEADLQPAAKGSGATVPATLDQDHQARLTALRGKSGVDFDKAYLADQVENHLNALTLYGDYMMLGDNKKLNALAVDMIPITQAQLNEARTLAGD